MAEIANPFRPGAGHYPPYLAGRDPEIEYFGKLLEQGPILENLVLTGLRGVGKTVLLDTFKPRAVGSGWLWAGADLSESSSVSESSLATRVLADLAVLTSGISVAPDRGASFGFAGELRPSDLAGSRLGYQTLVRIHNQTPGLASDRLKGVLELAWPHLARRGRRGVVFAYDEAQNLSDHAGKDEYPLAMLLDVFQSLQRKGLPLMLVLTGLPTLFPKLVEARTFSERMFHVMFLSRLNPAHSRKAVVKPIEDAAGPVRFDDASVDTICRVSGGYPYFIQFICREAFDVWIQRRPDDDMPSVPVDAIFRKLDSNFFSGRWAQATDRQRTLLRVIASLPGADDEFTVRQIVEASKRGDVTAKPFSGSHVHQMLASLIAAGLVYRNRHGRYSFAVPLLADYIRRQDAPLDGVEPPRA